MWIGFRCFSTVYILYLMDLQATRSKFFSKKTGLCLGFISPSKIEFRSPVHFVFSTYSYITKLGVGVIVLHD